MHACKYARKRVCIYACMKVYEYAKTKLWKVYKFLSMRLCHHGSIECATMWVSKDWDIYSIILYFVWYFK